MANSEIQKTNITLKMLLDSGVLSAGLPLVCNNPNVNGILNGDGSITIWRDDRERKFDYLSDAARHIEKRSLNGWFYCGAIIDGDRRNLGDFRDQYLKVREAS